MDTSLCRKHLQHRADVFFDHGYCRHAVVRPQRPAVCSTIGVVLTLVDIPSSESVREDVMIGYTGAHLQSQLIDIGTEAGDFGGL